MNVSLFAIALVMSVVAFGFVATPLLRVQRISNKGSANVALLGAVVVFGLGIALYGAIGRPDAAGYSTQPSSSRPAATEQQGARHEKAGSVASLIDGLEARLEKNPDDGKGWLLLAQSYEFLGRPEDAAGAYDRAGALGIYKENMSQ